MNESVEDLFQSLTVIGFIQRSAKDFLLTMIERQRTGLRMIVRGEFSEVGVIF